MFHFVKYTLKFLIHANQYAKYSRAGVNTMYICTPKTIHNSLNSMRPSAQVEPSSREDAIQQLILHDPFVPVHR